jgi:1-phosphatidylinositol-4-phosphate 5-kinase
MATVLSLSCSCRYVWVDSNEYDGEWRAGKMGGQGTFVWKTGERYDGEWLVSASEAAGLPTVATGTDLNTATFVQAC